MSKKKLIYSFILIIFLWGLNWSLLLIYSEGNDRGTFGDMFGAANSLFSGLALAGIIYTIYLQIDANKIQLTEIKKEDVRRKREATIDYVTKVRPIYKKLSLQLNKTFKDEGIKEITKKQLTDNPDLLNNVKEFLGMMEHLSAGVNAGVFDRYMLINMSGTYFRNNFKRYSQYINDVQKTTPTAYTEFKKLNQIIIDIMEKKKNGTISDEPD